MRPLRLIVALASCLLAGAASAQEICDLSDRLDLDPAGTQTPVETAFGGGMVFLVANGLLTVVDEATLEVRATLALPAGIPQGAVWRDGFVYISASTNRLRTVDATDPDLPELVSDIPFADGNLVSVSAGLAVINNGSIRTLDISEPSLPAFAGIALSATISRNSEAAAYGDAVYVAAVRSGLLIFDASDLAGVYLRQAFVAPRPDIGSGSRSIRSVSVIDDRAFVGFQDGEIWSLNLSRPFVPVRTGVFGLDDNWFTKLQAVPGLLIAGLDNGVVVLSTADPDDLAIVLELTEVNPTRFWAEGSLLVGQVSSTESVLYGIDRCNEPCPADLAAPFGELNFFDALAFLNAFAAQDAAADLAEPFGAWDFFDITAYLAAFNAGCPE